MVFVILSTFIASRSISQQAERQPNAIEIKAAETVLP
jgi:hypothetical protein